jgi:hypothetical protein
MTRTVHFVMEFDPPWVKLHQLRPSAPGQNGQFMPRSGHLQNPEPLAPILLLSSETTEEE